MVISTLSLPALPRWTLIFSVPQNKLLWAAVSETKNPKSARQLLADLVKTTAKELQKQGLASKPK